MTASWAVLITAAGSSARMDAGTKKELREVGGEIALVRTLKAFLHIPGIEQAVVTSRHEDIKRIDSLLEPLRTYISLHVTEGGRTRQDSVRRGLLSLVDTSPAYVLIHDGARPWVSAGLIRGIMRCTETHGACIPVVPSVDALKQVEGGVCVAHPDRTKVVCAQTPQGFSFPDILEAHSAAAGLDRAFADDAEVFAFSGKQIFVTEGNPENRKITYPHDLESI